LKKYPNKGIPNENLGGRTSDNFANFDEILNAILVFEDEARINAYKILLEGHSANFLGNANIFEMIERI
jgi:hypothetical protein